MGRVFVFGSINLDLIANVARLPQAGETVRAESYAEAPGGKGANQALAARRAGADVVLCGAVGQDGHAGPALSLLEESGVDLARVKQVEGPSGIALIFVDATGENVITIVPGANGTLSPADAQRLLGALGPEDVLMCQQEVPADAVGAALHHARACGAKSMLNTAPIIPETGDLAALADIVVTNETEFAHLAQMDVKNDIEAAVKQHAQTTGQNLVVTLGRDGVVAVMSGRFLKAAALPVQVRDSVGAGDTFCGYLATGILEGLSAEDSLIRAAAAGSLACTKPGAQPAIPQRDAVLAALK